MIASHADLQLHSDIQGPKSMISMRSKGAQSIGEETEELLRENADLRSSIVELGK